MAKRRRKAKWEQEEHKVFFDGDRLTFPWCYDDDAVRQVNANRDWLRDYLGVSAPPDLIMQPVVVVPGWFVESEGNYKVKAMNAEYLVRNYLTKLKGVYTPRQLATVIQRLDDRCRSLEF